MCFTRKNAHIALAERRIKHDLYAQFLPDDLGGLFGAFEIRSDDKINVSVFELACGLARLLSAVFI